VARLLLSITAGARSAVGSKKDKLKGPTRPAAGHSGCVGGIAENTAWVAIGASCVLVVLLRAEGLFGCWVVERSEWARGWLGLLEG
jgi:hypothetical protein